MFIGAFDQATPWSMNGVKGCFKFIEKVWATHKNVVDGDEYSPELESAVHKMIKKVTEDIDRMKFNTAIASMMAFMNDVSKNGKINKAEFKTLLVLLNPFAPHVTEEMWQNLGYEGTIAESQWPKYDESKTVDNEIEIVLQINGKVRDKIVIGADEDNESVKAKALANEKIISQAEGTNIVKVIVIPKKLVNIVVK